MLTQTTLIDSLTKLHKFAADIPLVPQEIIKSSEGVKGKKRPVGNYLNWPNITFVPKDLATAIKKRSLHLETWKDKGQGLKTVRELSERVNGYAILCGARFTYQCQKVSLVAVDIDGEKGFKELASIIATLPKTVAWTSGLPHRCTHLFYVEAGRDNGVKTRKKEDLEFRFTNHSVTVPPSDHPETEGYQFLEGQSFEDVAIAKLPDEIYQAMITPDAKKGQLSLVTKLEDIALPVNAAFPLYLGCSKTNRDYLFSGVPAGSRHNDIAMSVAKDLVAVQRHLESIGQQYDYDAWRYYEDFVAASGLQMGSLEKGRYDDAIKKNDLYLSCTEEGLYNSIRGWYWREVLKLEQRSNNGNGNGKKPAKTPEQSSEIWEYLVKIYCEEHNPKEIESRLVGAVASFGIPQREVQDLWKRVSEFCDQQLKLDFATESFQEFLAAQAADIKLSEVLPPALAEQLTIAAEGKCHPLRYLSYLWPAAANLVGGKVFIWGSEAMRWKTDLVFFCVDVGPSSAGKTPAANDIMFYLRNKQTGALHQESENRRTYSRLKSEWNELTPGEKEEYKGNPEIDPRAFLRQLPPTPIYLYDNPTLGAIEKTLEEQPTWHSAIWFSKEVASILSSLDQFKSGGKGNDRQFLLDAFDGRIYRRSDRKTEESTTSLRGQMIQLAGGTQMDVLRRYLSLTDYQDGLTNRFLMIDPPSIPVPDEMPTALNNANELLETIFKRLETIPVEVIDHGEPLQFGLRFAPDAFVYWDACWVGMRHLIADKEITDPNYASYLGKLLTYYLRLCGLLSLIWQASEDDSDRLVPDKIPLHVAEKAWKLIQYYAAQYLKIRQVSDLESNDNAGLLSDIWRYVQSKGSITAREVVRYFGKKKMKATEAKVLLEQLNKNGCGELTVNGRSVSLAYKQVGFISAIQGFDVGEPIVIGSYVKTSAGRLAVVDSISSPGAINVIYEDSTRETLSRKQLTVTHDV